MIKSPEDNRGQNMIILKKESANKKMYNSKKYNS